MPAWWLIGVWILLLDVGGYIGSADGEGIVFINMSYSHCTYVVTAVLQIYCDEAKRIYSIVKCSRHGMYMYMYVWLQMSMAKNCYMAWWYIVLVV